MGSRQQRQPSASVSQQEIFWGALEQPTPEARASFLESACANDPALRASVEALLRHHKDDAFLETPAIRSPGTGRTAPFPGLSIPEQAGDRIGPYRLLQKIGEGGVGIVFMAEQESPIRRRVALKVLRPGMDSGAVIARFESERQALALIEHPNIARVFDAGTTGSGRPFFVMELVHGPTITAYCDQHRLAVRERIELFLQVCEAIQHAHHKGIIHRDIKPSNVLVTLRDGRPCVKVIDFGIAKALDHPLTDRTLFTEVRTLLGTPAYMSPEQADLGGTYIDTRTDIYSLGVLLYELLVGRTPFDQPQLRAAGLDSLRRILREQDPPAPSKRFRTLPPADQRTIAHQRRTHPDSLLTQLQGDLDWIVLKALEKDPVRRYPTAHEFALDLERFLQDQPVQARPPSALYRLGKLIRRHRLVSLAASTAGLALLIGLGLAAWQYREKSLAYERILHAEREQARLRQEAEFARAEAEARARMARLQAYAADMNLAQQALAVNNLGRARQLLDRRRTDPAQPPLLPAPRYGSVPEPSAAEDLRGWEWRYLWQLCQSEALYTLCRLPREIERLDVSHDGRIVAIGQTGGPGISLWDLRARKQVAQLPPGTGRGPFAFSPTAPYLVCVDAEDSVAPRDRRAPRQLRIWDWSRHMEVASVPLEERVTALAFAQDGTRLLVVLDDTDFILWHLKEPSPRTRLSFPFTEDEDRPLLGTRTSVTLDLNLAAQALGNGRVRVLDLTQGRQLWSGPVAAEHVTALALAPQGQWLATAGGFVETTVYLWEARTGRPLARLQGHRTYVRALQFWPDGQTLASASGDQTIQLWDLRSLQDLSAAFPPLAPQQGSTSSESVPQPAELREMAPRSVLRGHRLEVWSLALCPDQTTLLSGAKDGEVCVWDTASVPPRSSRVILPVTVRAWTFTPEGHGLLTLDEQGYLTRWSGPSFRLSEPLLRMDVTEPIRACFSPDAAWVAVATSGGTVQVWSPSGHQPYLTLPPGATPRWPVGFLPRQGQLVTYEPRETVYRGWDLVTGSPMWEWRPSTGHSLHFGKLQFWRDQEGWLTLAQEDRVYLWNVETGEPEEIFLPLRQMTAVALAPQGRWLAAVSLQGMGVLYDRQEQRTSAVFHGFLQGAHSVAFSPDGRRIAIGSNGQEAVKLWDTESLQELLTLSGQGSIFHSTAFSPDGNALASCNQRGQLHIWVAPSFEEIERAERSDP